VSGRTPPTPIQKSSRRCHNEPREFRAPRGRSYADPDTPFSGSVQQSMPTCRPNSHRPRHCPQCQPASIDGARFLHPHPHRRDLLRHQSRVRRYWARPAAHRVPAAPSSSCPLSAPAWRSSRLFLIARLLHGQTLTPPPRTAPPPHALPARPVLIRRFHAQPRQLARLAALTHPLPRPTSSTVP